MVVAADNRKYFSFRKFSTHATHTADRPRTARRRHHSARKRFLIINELNDIDLAGHHNEGGGEPVLLEHLALGTDEGEVEANRRSGSHVCNKKALSLPCM